MEEKKTNVYTECVWKKNIVCISRENKHNMVGWGYGLKSKEVFVYVFVS